MKIIKFLLKKRKPTSKQTGGFYMDSIERAGRDQIQKMIEKGLSIPIVML